MAHYMTANSHRLSSGWFKADPSTIRFFIKEADWFIRPLRWCCEGLCAVHYLPRTMNPDLVTMRGSKSLSHKEGCAKPFRNGSKNIYYSAESESTFTAPQLERNAGTHD